MSFIRDENRPYRIVIFLLKELMKKKKKKPKEKEKS